MSATSFSRPSARALLIGVLTLAPAAWYAWSSELGATAASCRLCSSILCVGIMTAHGALPHRAPSLGALLTLCTMCGTQVGIYGFNQSCTIHNAYYSPTAGGTGLFLATVVGQPPLQDHALTDWGVPAYPPGPLEKRTYASEARLEAALLPGYTLGPRTVHTHTPRAVHY